MRSSSSRHLAARRVAVGLRTCAALAAACAFACTKPAPQETPERAENAKTGPVGLWDGVPPLASQDGDVSPELAPREGPKPPPSVSERVELPFPPPAVEDGAAPEVAAGPLQVVRRGPDGEQGAFDSISVVFNQPMVPLASVDQLRAEAVPIVVEPAPPGKIRWLGTEALAYEADGRFPFSTAYTVTIPKGTRSVLGGELAKEVKFGFSTPTLELVSSYPAPGSSDALLDTPIVLHFNQAIRRDELLAGLELRAGGKAIALVPVSESGWGSLDGAAAAHTRGVDPNRVVVLRPKERLTPNTTYSVKIPGGALGEGPLPTKAQIQSFSTYPPLKITGPDCQPQGCSPSYTIHLETTTPLQASAADLDALVTVTPEVEGLKVSAGYGLVLSGKFVGETSYTVEVEPGLKDIHGQEMTTAYKGTLRTTAYEPRLRVVDSARDLAVIERDAGRTLPLEVAGVDSVEVRTRALGEGELATFLNNRWYDVEDGWPNNTPPASGAELLDAASSRKLPARLDLDLSGHLEPAKVLFLTARTSPFERWGYRQRVGLSRFIEVSDLGVTAALDRDSGTVLVTSIRSGAPLAGVDLELRARGSERPLWSGRTDAGGLAAVSYTGSADNGNFLYARSGDDVAYLPLDSDVSGSWWGAASATQPRAFFFTDREPYKPGETVHLSGVLRREVSGPAGGVELWRTGFTAKYAVHGPRGHQIADGEAKVSSFGTFSIDVELPEGADLGDYWLNLEVGGGWFGSAESFSHSFAVESYRAPEFEVAVERLEASPLVFGDTLKAEIRGAYLHGAPLVGGVVRYTVRRDASGYTPPGSENAGFTFGEGWGGWWRWGFEGRPSGGGTLVAEGEGALDPRGVFTVEHAVKAIERDLHAPKGSAPAGDPDAPARAATYTLEASVTDQNRQAIAGRGSFVVHPALRYVGVRSDRNVYREGERAKVEAVVVDLDGKRVAEVPITLNLVRSESRRRAVEKDGRWVYEYTTEEVAAGGCSPISGAAPASCELDLSKAGTYSLRATVRDEAGRTSESRRTFFVYGADSTVAVEDQRRVDLVPDKRSYEPGDTATLLVRAPFEAARGLLVIERDGIAETRPLEIKGGSATVEVALTESMIPNVHVAAIVDRGRVDVPGAPPGQDLGRPAQAFGAVELEIGRGSKEIVVDLAPDREELAPKETLRLRLRTKTRDGDALPAAVAVMVVDEGVLSLMNFQTPNPLEFFHRKRSPGARIFDLRSYLLRRQELAGDDAGPEDPAPEPEAVEEDGESYGRGRGYALPGASPAKPVALGLADDKNKDRAAQKKSESKAMVAGNAEASAATEVSLRTLFATTAFFAPEIRTDSGGEAVVEIPMPENLTAFRIMAVAVDPEVADRFGSADTRVRVRKPIMIRPSLPRFANFGDRFEAAVMVDNQTGADQAIEVGTRALGVTITGVDRQTVQIPAGESREVRFPMSAEDVGRARVQFAALSPGGRDATEVTFPIQVPATRQAFATYGVTESSVAQLIKAPLDALPGFGGLELSLSSTALAGLEDATRFLLDYDYECSEQTASRLLPIFVLGPILEGFGITDGAGEARRKAISDAGIARLLGRQNHDGGFRLWDLPSRSWPYVSAWVTFALVEGKEAGFVVEPRALERALDYLSTYVARGDETPWGRTYDWTSRAFALWLLSRENKGAEHFERVWSHRADLPLYAQGWMLSAAQRYKKTAVVDRLRADFLARATEDAKIAHFIEAKGEALADGLRMLMHSSVQSDAVALMALLEVAPDEALLPKVMAGIMAERDPRDGGRWATTHANAWALLAANRYFKTVEKVEPDFAASVFLGDSFAGSQEFRGRSMAVTEQRVPMRRLQESPEALLTLAKDGPGKLYYRLGLRYAPADLKMKAESQGFVVYRTYEAVAQGGGEPDPSAVRHLEDGSWEIKAGALVKVNLTLVARDRATYVVVDDPLPAGLEGQNQRFQTTIQDVGGSYGGGRDDGYGYGEEYSYGKGSSAPRGRFDWWYPWWRWDHTELRDDRLLLFADRLPAGIYTYSYLAKATTIGEFQLPPVHAEGMYTPERFGHSASSVVRVLE
ncbi:MAG: MG2 domain-containing protein [Nannocystaceae bacterium]